MHTRLSDCTTADRSSLRFCFTGCCERSTETSIQPEGPAEQHPDPAQVATYTVPRQPRSRWTSTTNLDLFQGAFQPISF